MGKRGIGVGWRVLCIVLVLGALTLIVLSMMCLPDSPKLLTVLTRGPMEVKPTRDGIFEALRDTDVAARRGGQRLAILDGTLLGAVREGDIIPWDYDADVGVEPGKMDAVVKALRTHLDLRKYRLDAAKTFARVVGPAGWVDIQVLVPGRDGRSRHGTPLMRIGSKSLPTAHMYPFTTDRPYRIRGYAFDGPHNAEGVLRDEYGADWRIPKSSGRLQWMAAFRGGKALEAMQAAKALQATK